MQALRKFGKHFVRQPRGIRNEAAKTPEDRINLANNSIRLKFTQPRQRHLNVRILLHEDGIVAPGRETQISEIDVAGNLAKGEVAVGRVGVERIGAVDVRTSRRNERQVHHRQGPAQGREGRARVSYKVIFRILECFSGSYPLSISLLPEIDVLDDFHWLDLF